MMGLEMPMVSAVMARLTNPEISLAAYGGIVFPLALLIEAPIIMVLAASTALSRDWPSYRRLRRFVVTAGVSLTSIHVLVAFTPLFDVVIGALGSPEEIRGAGRLGLMILTPWTGSIAIRRFQQGVLIRFGRSGVVGTGTVVRLLANASVLAVGVAIGSLEGIVVAAAGVSMGVIAEAVFVNRVVQPVLRDRLRPAVPEGEPLSWLALLRFYTPLAMTPLLGLLVLPIGSAAMSRMPNPIASLAVWPVLSGITFTLRSLGIALNEVVVALLDRPNAASALRSFSVRLAGANTLLLVLIAATPLSTVWFAHVSALSPELTELARRVVWVPILAPAFGVFQSWYQGTLVHSRRTRAITEAVAINVAVVLVIVAIGISTQAVTGIYVGLLANSLGLGAQMAWVRHRSRSVRRRLSATPTLLREAPSVT